MTNKINSGNLESPNKTMLPFNEKVEQNTINNNLNSNLKSQPTEITGTNNMKKTKINSGNLESPNKTMLPFNEKVEQNIINQQNKVNNEKKIESINKQKKMKKEETKNGTVMTTNMNKYLELSFENAGLIISDNSRNVSNRFVEPITIFQVSNVIHNLFGERTVPKMGIL